MTRYTLQMSNDDCGGLSEYIEFFSSLRQVFRIRKQREELRDEIQDVLSLVESSYLEEQRKYTELEKFLRFEEKKVNKKIQDKKMAKQIRFERLVAVVSIAVLPTALIAAIFGMNVPDLPKLNFWPLMGTTLAVSVLLMLVFVAISWERQASVDEYYGYVPAPKKIKKKKKS